MPASGEAKVKLTINDIPVEVSPNTSVIQAAEAAGISIPHYCYHPDLSIAGVCRMCTVEIEKMPRLQISCNTQVREGMVVRTNTDKVNAAVKSALELHLINHPLDCPICDKAGECQLQNYYSDHGLYESRMDFEKVHKPKVQDIGTIVLDSERCILCTRCVRFTSEVSQSHEFAIMNRGDRSELCTYDQGPLRNDYTGNLADICPVGALTAKDFRFQQRVWFLEKTASVCTLCARGCNTQVSRNPKTNKLYRVEPRRNPEVNSSWICDRGRWDYHYLNSETRLPTVYYRSEQGEVPATWEHFFKEAASWIAEDPASVLVAISTFSTNEEIADCVGSLQKLGLTEFTWLVDEASIDQKEPWDGILQHKDQTPNAAGFQKVFETFGERFHRISDLKKVFAKGTLKRVMLLGLETENPPGLDAFMEGVPKEVDLVIHATNATIHRERARWLLPNVTSFEKSGTALNTFLRLQKLHGALPPQDTARNLHALSFGITQGNDRKPSPQWRAQQIYSEVLAPAWVEEGANWEQMNEKGLPLTQASK